MSNFLLLFVVGTSTGGGTEITTSDSSNILLYVIPVGLAMCAVIVVVMVAYIVHYAKKRYKLFYFKTVTYKVTKK